VGEALTNSRKSSAGLSDALLAMVAMLLLGCCSVVRTAAEYLKFECVTIAKSRRLAKNMDRVSDRNQPTSVSSFLEWKLKARTHHACFQMNLGALDASYALSEPPGVQNSVMRVVSYGNAQ
jgi:hypothetical protein